MADINDPEGLRDRLNRELGLLDKAAEAKEGEEDSPTPIPEEDRDEVRGFLNHLRANKNNASQTNANHIQRLRITSQRSEKSLVEMDKVDVDRMATSLQDDYGCKKRTVNHYKGSWRCFFRFLGRDWSEEILFYDIDDDGVDKSKIYSDDEIDEMLKTADGRTTAAIAVLADTGCRIGALCSCYNGDTDLDGDIAVITLNDQAPLKGAEGNVPLTWSRSYLVNYRQNNHPRPDQDDVALIHKHESFDKTDSGAVSPTRLRETIKEVMEEVGIDKERREIHHFRHTAVTKWLRMGVSKEVIQHRTKWADMSMLDKYSHLLEEDKDMMTAEEFGLINPTETEAASDPEEIIGECPICGTTIRSDVRYCAGCGNPITTDAAHKSSPANIQAPESIGEELVESESVREEMEPAAIIEQLLNQHPELLDKIDLD